MDNKYKPKTIEELEKEFKELELDFKFLIDIYNKEEVEKNCYYALCYKVTELFYNVLKRI
jgi:hypothetical protein